MFCCCWTQGNSAVEGARKLQKNSRCPIHLHRKENASRCCCPSMLRQFAGRNVHVHDRPVCAIKSSLVHVPTYDARCTGKRSYASCLCRLACSSVPAGLEVEGTLVLQPPPVPGHAANLLAIVIRGRICKGGSSRVNPVALDAVEEARIFLSKRQYSFAMKLQCPVSWAARLTAVNSASTPRYARLKTWLPNMGPISHPTAIMPNVLNPISMNGSRPPSWADSVAS
jgi:hypothetical protein